MNINLHHFAELIKHSTQKKPNEPRHVWLPRETTITEKKNILTEWSK